MAQGPRDFTVDPPAAGELTGPAPGQAQKGQWVGEVDRDGGPPAAAGAPPPAAVEDAPAPAVAPAPAAPRLAAPRNPYDDVVDGILGTPGQLPLRQAAQALGEVTPQQAAETRRLAIQYGVPPEVVQRHLPEFQQRETRDLPVPQILADTPALGRWAAQPGNLAVVQKDDLTNLGALSWIAEAPGRAFAQGINQTRYGWLRGMSLVRALTQEEQDQLNAFKFHGELGSNLGDVVEGAPVQTWFRGAITGGARQLPNTFGALAAGVYGGLLGGAMTGAAGAAVGSVAPGPGTVAGAVAGAGYGFTAGFGYNAWKFTTLLEAGNAADEFEAFRDDQGRPLPPEVVRMASLAAGSINGLLELAELKYIAQAIPGLRSLGRAGVRRGVLEALHTPTVRTALYELAKNYGEAMIAEPITEVAQRAVTILAGELGKGTANLAGADATGPGQGPAAGPGETTALAPAEETAFQAWATRNHITDVDHPDSHYDYRGFWQETGGPAIQGGVDHFPDTYKQHGHPTFSVESRYSTGPGDGGTWEGETFVPSPAGPGFAPRSPSDVVADLTGEYLGAVQSFALMTLPGPGLSLAFDLRRARLAQANQALLLDLGKGIRQSTTAQVVPGAVQGLVGEAVTGTPHETVYIDRDVWKEYWQSQQVDPAEMFAHVSGDPTAYDTAAADGELARLALPLARYAEVLGGDETHHAFFAPELRVGDPDAFNGRESEQYHAEQAADAALQAIADLPPAEEGVSRVAPIRAAVLGRLASIDMDPAQAEKLANLYEAMGSLFERAGEDPATEMAGYSLTVLREGRNGRRIRTRAPQVAASAQTKGPRSVEEESTGVAAAAAGGSDVRRAAGEQPAADEGRLQPAAGDERGVSARRPALPDDPVARAAALRDEFVARFPDTSIDEQFARQPAADAAARLTGPVRRELVRILDELETYPYVKPTWSELEAGEGLTGNAAGGHMNRVAGSAGAEVYNDVLALAPYNRNTKTGATARNVHGERSQVEAAVRQLLLTGQATSNLMEGALRTAERREAGFVQARFKTQGVSDPALPHQDAAIGETPEWTHDELGRAIADQLAASTAETTNLLDAEGFPLESETDELATDALDDDSFDTRTLEQGLFDHLPAPAATRTLYRWQSAKGPGVPAWMETHPSYQAAKAAAGSWFTENLADIEFYKQDAQGQGHLVTIELPIAEAEQFRVANHPEAARYSASPDTEYFVPAERRLPGETGAVRDQEVATPQFEAPFALTSEAAAPKTVQRTLFQSRGVASVLDWTETAPAAYEDGFPILSTRVPFAAKRTAQADVLRTDLAAVLAAPSDLADRMADEVRTYPQLTEAEQRLPTAALLETFVTRVQDNLRFLYEAFAEHRERAKLWYVGAHRLAGRLASRNGVTHQQAAGVLAVLSPQMDWFKNVALAARVMRLHPVLKARNEVFTEKLWREHEQRQWGQERTALNKTLAEDGQEAADDQYAEWVIDMADQRAAYAGKTWRELSPIGQAMLLRAHDERRSRTYQVITPEGDLGGLARRKDGTPAAVGWSTFTAISNAIAILEDNTLATIHERVGSEHKVRSFFNNISAPWSAHSVTIDTHAVAAGLLSPMSGEARAVKQAMGGPADAMMGLSGTNALYAEANFRLAEELGVLPREVQSVTWEAGRMLFRPEQKRSARLTDAAAQLWQDHRGGRITLGELHTRIVDLHGGIGRPAWADAGARVADDQGGVPARLASDRGGQSTVPARRRATRADSTGPAGRGPHQLPGDAAGAAGRELFQAAAPVALTSESVQAWADALRARLGPTVQAFDLSLSRTHVVHLELLAVQRSAVGQGLGTTVLRELTRFADQQGVRLALSLAEKGFHPVAGSAITTSSARLERFYQRFGFVANRGRTVDYTLSAGMYREPTLPTPGTRELFQAPAAPAAPVWFSRLSRAVEDSQQTKAQGAQWKATIKNAKSGIDQGEWALAKVDDLVDGRSYTKQEVLAYLSLNEVQVAVKTLAPFTPDPVALAKKTDAMFEALIDEELSEDEDRDTDSWGDAAAEARYNEDEEQWEAFVGGDDVGTWYATEDEAYQVAEDERLRRQDQADAERRQQVANRINYDQVRDAAREELEAAAGDAPHFSTYVLAGGDEGSYREVFLTMPPQVETPFDPAKVTIAHHRFSASQGETSVFYDGTVIERFGDDPVLQADGTHQQRGLAHWQVVAERIFNKGDRNNRLKQIAPGWRDGHGDFDDIKNPVVRLRLNTRTGTNGARVLFLEEVQPPSTENQKAMPALAVKHWRALAFKWAIAQATAMGLDAVAWTTGQQQADRYSLEKQIGGLEYYPASKQLVAFGLGDHREREVFRHYDVTPDTVADYVGKETAAKLLAARTPLEVVERPATTRATRDGRFWLVNPAYPEVAYQKFHTRASAEASINKERFTLYGQDLKVGGEGLKQLYDVDLPRAVNGLPAVKRLGLKVQTLQMGRGDFRAVAEVDADLDRAWSEVADVLPTRMSRPRPQIEADLTAARMAATVGGTAAQMAAVDRLQEEVRFAIGETWTTGATEARPTRAQAHVIEQLNQERKRSVLLAGGAFTAPALFLTPELRASVTAGQPRFQDPPAPEGHADKRGSIRFGPNKQITISLFEHADKSTFLHETGHLFLEMFGDTAERMAAIDPAARTATQQGIVDDYAGALAWLGVGTRSELQVAQEEQFARGFEAYLFEGEAPSLRLQATFARFRFWLQKLYHSITALNVQLTPEVRGIMGRLLATDQAIAEAQAQHGAGELFTTAADAGMSDAEFALYRETIAQASRTAREQIDQRLLKEVTRESSQAWADARTQITAEVTADVDAEPVQRAIAAITRGTNPDGTPFPGSEDHVPAPFPLARGVIAARYGVPRLERLDPALSRAEGGLDPDLLAEMFGFSSGDQLLTALEEAPSRAQAIVEQVETRLHAEQGSLMDNTQALVAQAHAALANEDRERVIRAEVRALNKLRRTVAPFVRQHEQANRSGPTRIAAGVPPQATLRAAAQRRIAELRVRDLKPHLFWSASRRAAQTAIDSAARHDFAAAVTAKTQELQQLHLYREATRVLEEIESRVTFAKGLDKPSAQQRLGLAGGGTAADGTSRLNILQQVQGILDRYAFATQTAKALDRRESFKKFLEQTERAGLPTDFPDHLLDDARRTPYQALTTDDFMAVTDGLKALVHLAQLKNKLLAAQDQRALEEVTTNLASSIRAWFDKSGRTPPPAARRDRSGRQERKRGRQEAWVDHRKLASLARELDGFQDGGPMLEAIIWPLNKAADTEAVMNAHFAEQMHQLLQRVFPHGALPDLSTMAFVPAIGRSFSRMARIAIVLNWGNEGNRDRLRAREGWTDQHLDAIFATLSKPDFDFAQGVLDIVNSYWPEIAAKQERVYGVAPEKVAAVPIQTPFGLYAGGYYSLKYDDRESPRVAGHLEFDDAKLAQAAAYAQATTQRNHTKARLEDVKLPIRFDFGPLFEHMRMVIHDLSHHEALIDVARVLSSDAVAQAIYDTHGDQVYKTFRAGIKDVAIGDTPATDAFEKAINHVRAGGSVVGLGWNVMTLLQQPLGLFNSMERIGVKWVGVGVRDFFDSLVTRTNRVQWIMEVSPLMRHRAGTMTREISEIRNQVSIPGPIASKVDRMFGLVTGDRLRRQAVLDSFFAGIALTQSVADRVTWLGQYAKAQASAETHERSVQLADQAVLDSQGGGQIKDLARVQRGGPLKKVWTNFYSVFNVIHNQLTEVHRRTDLSDPLDVARALNSYLLLWVLPASLGYAMKRGLRGDDDDWLAGLVKENLGYVLGTVMGVRELASAVQGFRGYEGPAGSRFFATAGRLAKQSITTGERLAAGTADKDDSAAFLGLLNEVTGMLAHYPAVQIARTAGGVAALAEGRSHNPLVLLVGPPRKQKAGGS